MFLNDQETKVDLLYYEAIAKTVVKLVRETPTVPVTVGVHGDWGAGKSSVLKMVELAFSKDERVLCLWFNGWTFEGFEDAKAVVIETIVDELRRARPGVTKVADAARKVLKRVDWLKLAKKAGGFAFTLATGIPSISQLTGLVEVATGLVSKAKDVSAEDLKGFAEQAGEYIKKADEADHLPEQIHAFRKEFEELLQAVDVDRLVVIVDDLDRCLPQTAIATLEAIRLFLFVARTAFIIGADELMIEYAVREHFPDLPPTSGPVPYARNYLEKLIQVPFRIPALGLAETRVYITLVLAEAALGSDDERFQKLLEAGRAALQRPWEGKGLDGATVNAALGKNGPGDVAHAVTISAQISRILADGTRGNPRQIKRFLNSMMLRHEIAIARGFGDEIERPILAKVMLAERFAPEFYEQLARLVGTSSDGKPASLALFEDTVRGGSTGSVTDGKQNTKNDKKAAPLLPKPTTNLPAEIAEWLNSDWAKQWAAVDPPLKGTDMRAYVFVTRDKRNYLGSFGAPSHLESLVDRLMGDRLGVAQLSGELAKLSGSEPEQVFEALSGQIASTEDLSTAPKGVQGVIALVKTRPALQRRLIVMLRELPIEKLGAWVATSWGECFSDPNISSEFHQLQQEWSTQNSNAKLSTAAKGAMAMKRS
jgi:predicted KAP-like P-loop ATPase